MEHKDRKRIIVTEIPYQVNKTTLIEKIVVHEAVKKDDGSREQEVEIFYRFIGRID